VLLHTHIHTYYYYPGERYCCARKKIIIKIKRHRHRYMYIIIIARSNSGSNSRAVNRYLFSCGMWARRVYCASFVYHYSTTNGGLRCFSALHARATTVLVVGGGGGQRKTERHTEFARNSIMCPQNSGDHRILIEFIENIERNEDYI